MADKVTLDSLGLEEMQLALWNGNVACQGLCPVDNLARKVACPAGKFYLQYLPWTTGQGFSSPGTSNNVSIFDTLNKSLQLYTVCRALENVQLLS